jgi:hypothetical protein
LLTLHVGGAATAAGTDLSETHQRREQRSNNRRKRARSHSPDEHDAG